MRIDFTTPTATYAGALQINGNSAILSTHAKNALTLGQDIDIGGTSWIVSEAAQSLYIPRVTNYTLRKK